MRTETIERTRRAIDALPEPQRMVVEMRMLDSKTFAEIAAELGVPLSTALTRMRLATDKLRTALEREEP
jgi:RNA polymerase sigma-70 factor (ECF subfamily)